MKTVKEYHSTVNNKQAEALSRARFGQTLSNYPAIIQGFAARGIPEDNILPRENIFTYAAWRALGRQVRRGEKGVKITTYIVCDKKNKDAKADESKKNTFRVPRSVSVFHVSQTDKGGS